MVDFDLAIDFGLRRKNGPGAGSMMCHSRSAVDIIDHPETLKTTHTKYPLYTAALSESLGVMGSASGLYLGISCSAFLDTLKNCMQ